MDKTMVSVPVEPTEAMIEAAQAIDNEMFAHGAMHGADANQIYRAMLAAAPAPQPVQGEAASPAGGGDCEHEWVDGSNSVVSNASVCLKCMTIAPTNALPEATPAAQPEQLPECCEACGRGFPQVDDDYREIAHLIGSIFYYGGFRAETYNERQLESLLRKVGHFYETEGDVLAASLKPKASA